MDLETRVERWVTFQRKKEIGIELDIWKPDCGPQIGNWNALVSQETNHRTLQTTFNPVLLFLLPCLYFSPNLINNAD